jgi:predicted NBD/HSP70 family sugar kinase
VGVAGRALGEVLAMAVAIVDPGTVLISGALARTGEHLIGAVREVVYQNHPARGLRIAEGRLGSRAGVAGATALVLDRVLAAETVDARLAAL